MPTHNTVDVLKAFTDLEPESYIALIATRSDYRLEITLDNNGPIQMVTVFFPINSIVKDTPTEVAQFIAQTAQTMIAQMVSLRAYHDHPEIFTEDDNGQAS